MDNRSGNASHKWFGIALGYITRPVMFVVIAVLLLIALPAVESAAQSPKPRGLAVASESPRAVKEAMTVLRTGGNAVDAAVTAALVAGVVSSSSSGIGGGGFANYWDAKAKKSVILDFREKAPAKIDAAAFGHRPFEFSSRGKWVGVPGEVAGLYELHRRYGSQYWNQIVERAAAVASYGFTVNRHVARVLDFSKDKLLEDPGLKSLWLPNGTKRVPAAGRLWKNPRLATTLRRIAQEGPRAIYEGNIAAEIVNTTRDAGGALSLSDLQQYKPTERAPLHVEWNGRSIYTMPPPSAGGYLLAHTLKLYKPEELKKLGHNTPAYVHALAESFRAALADRFKYIGDPDYESMDLERLLSPERLTKRRARIALNRTHTIPSFAYDEHGTHHIVTADGEGNVVSITVTVNRAFGAKLMTAQSGIVLNDELDDFSNNSQMGIFGKKLSPNRPRPGARPVSSMTPTLVVKDGQAVLAAGGSGGMTIATNVAQTVISQLLFDIEPQKLVGMPRFQIPVVDSTIKIPKEFSESFAEDLRQRGEIVDGIQWSMSAVQMLKLDGQLRWAGADPRKFGAAQVE